LSYLVANRDLVRLSRELSERRVSQNMYEVAALIGRTLPRNLQSSYLKTLIKRVLLDNQKSSSSMSWRFGNWIRKGNTDEIIAKQDSPETLGRKKSESLRSWQWEQVCRTGYRESRRVGLQRSYPFLDDRVWEFGLRVPPSHLLRGRRKKLLLFNAMKRSLPTQILHAEKRGLFDPVIEKGLADKERTLVRSLFQDSFLENHGLIDGTYFLAEYEKYVQAYANCKTYLGSFPVWRTIASELWARTL
jgi:hypothetical protein